MKLVTVLDVPLDLVTRLANIVGPFNLYFGLYASQIAAELCKPQSKFLDPEVVQPRNFRGLVD